MASSNSVVSLSSRSVSQLTSRSRSRAFSPLPRRFLMLSPCPESADLDTLMEPERPSLTLSAVACGSPVVPRCAWRLVRPLLQRGSSLHGRRAPRAVARDRRRRVARRQGARANHDAVPGRGPRILWLRAVDFGAPTVTNARARREQLARELDADLGHLASRLLSVYLDGRGRRNCRHRRHRWSFVVGHSVDVDALRGRSGGQGGLDEPVGAPDLPTGLVFKGELRYESQVDANFESVDRNDPKHEPDRRLDLEAGDVEHDEHGLPAHGRGLDARSGESRRHTT